MKRRKFLCGHLLLGLVFVLAFADCMQAAEKPTVAVFDFTVGKGATGKLTIETTRDSWLDVKEEYDTSLLTDKLITALTNSQKVSVIERKKLTALMEEMDLNQTELVDPANAVKVGKLMGSDYFVLGSLSMLDGKVSYQELPYNTGRYKITEFLIGANLRMVETETGKIVVAKSEKAKKRKKELNPPDSQAKVSVEFRHEVYDQLVTQLVTSVIDTLFPIKVARFANGTVYLNRGDLKPGTKYTALKLGEVIRDPDTNEILGQEETRIVILQITESDEKFSKAKVVEWLTDEKGIAIGALCRRLFETEQDEEDKPK